MDLIAHYKGVVETLRKTDKNAGEKGRAAHAAADFIEHKLEQPDVQKEMIRIAEEHAEDLEVADAIKARGNMSFVVDNIDNNNVQVRVEITSRESQENASRMFGVSNQIYEVLFGEQMSRYMSSPRSNPRYAEFFATGALKDLFVAWEQNRQPETAKGV